MHYRFSTNMKSAVLYRLFFNKISPKNFADLIQTELPFFFSANFSLKIPQPMQKPRLLLCEALFTLYIQWLDSIAWLHKRMAIDFLGKVCWKAIGFVTEVNLTNFKVFTRKDGNFTIFQKMITCVSLCNSNSNTNKDYFFFSCKIICRKLWATCLDYHVFVFVWPQSFFK